MRQLCMAFWFVPIGVSALSPEMMAYGVAIAVAVMALLIGAGQQIARHVGLIR